MIARGFGMRTADLGATDDPAGMLAEAMTTPGPCLINAPIDVNEKVYPMVPPGAANRTMVAYETVAG
jgi:acetolactate synthase-1/2/3 large subunit